jgi:probable rRNA maturation factor
VSTPADQILITIDEPFGGVVAEEVVFELARRVLEAEGVSGAELGVLVTDDEIVRGLNLDYAGDDHATDVLSFSLREGEEFVQPDAILRLGEVIVSYPTAERQAAEAGRTVEDEMEHLLVHGILHLLGHDHAEPDQEAKMRAREEALLGAVLRHDDL